MSLLIGIPDWILSPGDFIDDFGMPAAGLEAMFAALSEMFSEENVLKREARKTELNAIIAQSQADLKAKCEEYNKEQSQAAGDVIFIARLDCNDPEVVAKLFPDDSKKLAAAQDELANIDKFDPTPFIQVATELSIEKGVIKGQKKLLKKFLLHVLVNGFVYFQPKLPVPLPDQTQQVLKLMSVAGSVLQFIMITYAISGSMIGSFPFAIFSMPYSVSATLGSDALTSTCKDLYYTVMKPYAQEHKKYLENLMSQVDDHHSDANVIARRQEYDNIQINYNNELATLKAKIEADIQTLETQLGKDLADIATTEDTGDVILVSKTFFFPEGGEQITFSNECFDGVLTQLDALDTYVSGAIPLIQDNTVIIKLYNDYVRNNIVASYSNWKNLVEQEANAVVDLNTYKGLDASKEITRVSTKFTSIEYGINNLTNMNMSDQKVLKESIELIFTKTDVNSIRDFLPSYDSKATDDEKNKVDTEIKKLKPYVDTPDYNGLTQLNILVDEISSDFSIQSSNFYQPRVQFSQTQVDFVISRVSILELALTPVLNAITSEIDDLKSQLGVDQQTDAIVKTQISAKQTEYDQTKEYQNKFTRLRLYYTDNVLSHLIKADDFAKKVQVFIQDFNNIETDVSGTLTLVDSADNEDITVDLASLTAKYIDSRIKFDALFAEKNNDVAFTHGIRNFVGSETVLKDGTVQSQFEGDYVSITYAHDQVAQMDTIADSLFKQIDDETQKEITDTIAQIESLGLAAQDAKEKIKYIFSKNGLLKIIKYYQVQEAIINKKITDKKTELTNDIADLNVKIADLQNQLLVNTGTGESFITNIDAQKQLYQQQITDLQTQLDALPATLDLSTYYLYLVCSEVTKLKTQLVELEAQIAAGPDGYKAFKIPFDPYDELKTNIEGIIFYFFKHLVQHYRGLFYIVYAGWPWLTNYRFNTKFLKYEYVKKTAQNLIKELNGSNSDIFDQLVKIFVGNKLVKHLSLHIQQYAHLPTEFIAVPNPIWWYGIPTAFIPPQVIPPPFVPVHASGIFEGRML